MKILAIHNYYQQRGGEDQCFDDEVSVLQAHSHDVVLHTVHNDSIESSSKLQVARETLWNRRSYQTVRTLIREHRPDVAHVMNTFPLLTPSVLYAARDEGVPVIQEVQNYRTLCAGAFLLRDGHVCQECIGKRVSTPAIRHRCYRGSRVGSAVVALSYDYHRRIGTWQRAVDLFLCPSNITKKLLCDGGYPSERICVKPNVLNHDPGESTTYHDYAVFVGRLSPEKGLTTLRQAWERDPGLPPLKIIGDGPESHTVRAFADQDARVEWLGKRSIPELLAVVGAARCLVMPSLWYETFGRTTIEAFAKGTPVIGSKIGGTAEIIEHGTTGYLFEPGNPDDLARQIHGLWSLPSTAYQAMRQSARSVFLERYTSECNYRMLMDIYHRVVSS